MVKTSLWVGCLYKLSVKFSWIIVVFKPLNRVSEEMDKPFFHRVLYSYFYQFL